MVYVDPIDPPTAAAPPPSVLTRAEVSNVPAPGLADVRFSNSRGARTGVPVVAGINVVAGDVVLLEHLDGDPNLPVITGRLAVPALTVTALPTTGLYEGKEILFQTLAMATAGYPPWRLRYRALNPDGSPNASAYKWDCLGGGELADQADGAGVTYTTAGAYVFTAFPTPVLTLPLAGDYVVDTNSSGFGITASGDFRIQALLSGGVTGVEGTFITTVNGQAFSIHSLRRFTGVPAGATARLAYTSSTAGHQHTGYARAICVRPLRVG